MPIHNRCLTWVNAYLTEARPKLVVEPDDGTLFLTVDGTSFFLDRLTQLVRDHVKTSGVAKEGACHLFRHTLATVMLEGGADLRYVQAMLGHAELSTTQIYAQVSIRALQAVHRATHPGALHPVPAKRRDNDGDGESEQFITTLRAAPRELLAAALDQEIEEENREPAGSNGDPS